MKDYPHPNNAPSLITKGLVHKLSVNPPQTNKDANPKTQKQQVQVVLINLVKKGCYMRLCYKAER